MKENKLKSSVFICEFDLNKNEPIDIYDELKNYDKRKLEKSKKNIESILGECEYTINHIIYYFKRKYGAFIIPEYLKQFYYHSDYPFINENVFENLFKDENFLNNISHCENKNFCIVIPVKHNLGLRKSNKIISSYYKKNSLFYDGLETRENLKNNMAVHSLDIVITMGISAENKLISVKYECFNPGIEAISYDLYYFYIREKK